MEKIMSVWTRGSIRSVSREYPELVYHFVFELMEEEGYFDGDDAGAIATAAERAVKKAMLKRMPDA